MDSNNQDIFSQFHSFLQYFHSPDRTGLFKDVIGDNRQNINMLDQVLPGIGKQVDEASAFLSDAGNPFHSIFKGLGI